MALFTFGTSQGGVKPSYQANETGIFTSISCSTAGTISVKGTSIYEYIALGGSITGHIDPKTGITGVGTASAAGYFEALPATTVAIPMAANQTILGSFTHISTDGNFKGWGYAKPVDASGPHYY